MDESKPIPHDFASTRVPGQKQAAVPYVDHSRSLPILVPSPLEIAWETLPFLG